MPDQKIHVVVKSGTAEVDEKTVPEGIEVVIIDLDVLIEDPSQFAEILAQLRGIGPLKASGQGQPFLLVHHIADPAAHPACGPGDNNLGHDLLLKIQLSVESYKHTAMRLGATYTSPQSARTFLSFSVFASLILYRGRRGALFLILPIMASDVLAGVGLVSMNIAPMSGKSL